jgi:hypothetical protein
MVEDQKCLRSKDENVGGRNWRILMFFWGSQKKKKESVGPIAAIKSSRE